ncbi:uncharacterized protein LOC115751095 [Rhodamnia argentea]|uniref:Small ribosomal subunit protein mS38 n=1 Tax=Rhodamnia argentea TaxID=178133 RepID=A0A8B8QBY3_9MYRT|nr:uncharacterized protein LOC115751095 [Rhodamnia argentea]
MASSSSSLQRLLRRSLSARVASTLRQLQTPPPPPLSPLYQPHLIDGLPSEIPLLDPLWGLPKITENATRPRVPPPAFPSYPFGLYLGPIPSGSSVESEEEAVDSSDANGVWADSVKKKRKRKMNKHKYKKLRKRLRRQT